MKNYQEVEGDLIAQALQGEFDVIAHGCNCLSTMSAGIAVAMAETFGCDMYPMEQEGPNMNKLGCAEFGEVEVEGDNMLYVFNLYTQHYFKSKTKGQVLLDYEALTLCLRKMNDGCKTDHDTPKLHIGLPLIGCGLAGGDWERVKKIIQQELVDCTVTIVKYNQ